MYMDDEFRERLASFLSEYIDILDCTKGYGDDKVIRQGIKKLIESDIFTVKTLRQKAFNDYDIIIPHDFINECMK